jgi:hypothetical protein
LLSFESRLPLSGGGSRGIPSNGTVAATLFHLEQQYCAADRNVLRRPFPLTKAEPMRVPDFVLTPEEEALVSRIDFDASTLRTSEDMERNGASAAALMKSLSARDAIPEVRLRYFTDPGYFAGGRGKSRQELLERNGSGEKETFRRPEFLSYLHYFMHGPSLPQNVVDAFRNEVETCDTLGSGEIARIRKFAREQVRAHALEPARSAEEFYKLALDSGLPVSFAQMIHNSVRQVGRRR